jgi:hypothetical protein
MKNFFKKIWEYVNLDKKKSLGVLRHLLTFVGGLLIAKGIIDENVANEVIGGIITFIGILWSVQDKM